MNSQANESVDLDASNSLSSTRIGPKTPNLNVKTHLGGNAAQSLPELHNNDQNRKIYEMALEYIRQSAESACPEALTELGQIYEIGGIKDAKTGRIRKLTKKSIQKAKEHYQEAADLGCELAKNYLGQISFNYDKNFYKAFNYFKEASQSGKCAKALYNLAICYELGVHDFYKMNQMDIS